MKRGIDEKNSKVMKKSKILPTANNQKNTNKTKITKIEGKDIKKDYKKLRIKILVVIAVLFVIFAGIIIYFLFINAKPCKDKDCFDNALRKCDKVFWIREDEKATWFYKILGKLEKDTCKVEVTLLRIKQGKVDIEKLENKKMICGVHKNNLGLPEQDLYKCTGPLREELQYILLQKMHNYILQNLGEIEKGFF